MIHRHMLHYNITITKALSNFILIYTTYFRESNLLSPSPNQLHCDRRHFKFDYVGIYDLVMFWL